MPAMPTPAVVAIPVEALTASSLHKLADPTRSLGGSEAAAPGELPGGFDPASAMALAKLARLLPATLAAPHPLGPQAPTC